MMKRILFALVVLAQVHAQAAEPDHGVVCLSVVQQENDGKAAWYYLDRELGRQAILLAARDLGYATRDEALREPFAVAPKDKAVVFAPTVFADAEGKKQWVLIPGPDGTVHRAEAEHWPGLLENVQALEEAARGSIRKALASAGLKGPPAPQALKSDAEAPVPDPVKRLLGKLSPASQFAAVRSLHGLIRASGESPARLGALAQGYANLGKQSEQIYSMNRTVFLARALLYAARMVNLAPSPNTDRCLAYVCAMHTDMPGVRDVLDHCANREATWKKEGKPLPAAPAWADIVAHYAKFDFEALERDAAAAKGRSDAATQELALFLRFAALEPGNGPALVVPAAQDVLALNPKNVRAAAGLCWIQKVGVGRFATPQGLRLMSELTADTASVISDFPGALREAVARAPNGPAETAAGAVALVDAAAADRSEPSLAVMGRLLQEYNLTFVRYRLFFLRDQLGVPCADELRTLRPLLEGHPMQASLGAFGLDRPRNHRAEMANLLKDLNPVDLPPTAFNVIMEIVNAHALPEEKTNAWMNMTRRGGLFDSYYSYFLLRMFAVGGEPQHQAGKQVCLWWAKRDPYDVNPVRWLLENMEKDPDVQAAIPEWSKTLSAQPAYLRALGNFYGEKEQWAKQLEVFEKLVAVKSDPDIWFIVAHDYRRLGHPEKCLQILEEKVAAAEDYGLTGAKANQSIAFFHMDNGDYAKAQPFALKAAGSGSHWAMTCAGWCCEGLADEKGAGEWWDRCDGRYNRCDFESYFFRLRTGKSTGQDARALATKMPNSLHKVWLLLAAGSAAEAKEAYRATEYSSDGDDYVLISSGVLMTLLADEAKDLELRKAALARTLGRGVTHGQDIQHKFYDLAKLMQEALETGEKASLNAGPLQKILEHLPDAPTLGLYAAKFEMLHGSMEKAKAYYTQTFNADGPHRRTTLHNALLAIYGKALGLDWSEMEKKRPKPPPSNVRDDDMDF